MVWEYPGTNASTVRSLIDGVENIVIHHCRTLASASDSGASGLATEGVKPVRDYVFLQHQWLLRVALSVLSYRASLTHPSQTPHNDNMFLAGNLATESISSCFISDIFSDLHLFPKSISTASLVALLADFSVPHLNTDLYFWETLSTYYFYFDNNDWSHNRCLTINERVINLLCALWVCLVLYAMSKRDVRGYEWQSFFSFFSQKLRHWQIRLTAKEQLRIPVECDKNR